MVSLRDSLNTQVKKWLNEHLDERRFFLWYWCVLGCIALVLAPFFDGGYCENMGVQTVVDVIAALEAQNALHSKQTARKDERPETVRADAPRRGSGFDEILGPAGAFFAGWGGPPRPELMRARLRFGPKFIEMNFPKPVLLSWYMSEAQYGDPEGRASELLQKAKGNAEPTAGDRLRALLTK